MDDVSFYILYSFIYRRLNKLGNNFSDMIGAMLKKKYILYLFQRGGGKRKLGERKETRGEEEEEEGGEGKIA